MLLTVTGNSEDIYWAGEKWTPAESGTQKSVAPALYDKPNWGATMKGERWQAFGPSTTGVTWSPIGTAECLRLSRFVKVGSTASVFENRVNMCPFHYYPAYGFLAALMPVWYTNTSQSSIVNNRLLTSVRGGGGVYHNFFGTTSNPPSATVVGNKPTISDCYLSAANGIGSGISGTQTYNGVTYSWTQGVGW